MTAGASTRLDVVIPELGQVVRCRDRVWAVNEVAPSTLPEDAVSGARRQHLVRMSSLEDDGFGDELTVIWAPGRALTQVLLRSGRDMPVRVTLQDVWDRRSGLAQNLHGQVGKRRGVTLLIASMHAISPSR